MIDNEAYMPKIHSIRQNEVKESENSSFTAGQGHFRTEDHTKVLEERVVCRPPMVKQYYSGTLKTWLPYSLHPDLIGQAGQSQFEGSEVNEIHQESSDVDIRPHFFDPVRKEFILCDSGSQISAFPPEPGDSQLPNVFLKAANGSKIACYG